MQITLAGLRGLRDKVPPGKFVVTVSLYDRLGGSLLRWSRLKGQEWCATTLSFDHGGRFFDMVCEVSSQPPAPATRFLLRKCCWRLSVWRGASQVDQSVFTVCPSEKAIHPAMVVIFELFLLRGDGHPFDSAMGWAAFPLVNTGACVQGPRAQPTHGAHPILHPVQPPPPPAPLGAAPAGFEIVHGKFKTPMLRGSINHAMGKHSDILRSIHTNMDHWLCNL